MILFYCSVTLCVVALTSTALASPTQVEKVEHLEFENFSLETDNQQSVQLEH